MSRPKRMTPSEAREAERLAAAEAKYGALPESLAPAPKRKPCESCGKIGTGSGPGEIFVPELSVSVPVHLCEDCSPNGSRARNRATSLAERKHESFRSSRGLS